MKKLITLLFLSVCITTINAQDIKHPDSYNYTRGVEAIQQENYQDALDYNIDFIKNS